MSDILAFVVPSRDTIVGRTVEHVARVGATIWTPVPVGIVMAQNKNTASLVFSRAAIVATIASIALFALLNDASTPVTEDLA